MWPKQLRISSVAQHVVVGHLSNACVPPTFSLPICTSRASAQRSDGGLATVVSATHDGTMKVCSEAMSTWRDETGGGNREVLV